MRTLAPRRRFTSVDLARRLIAPLVILAGSILAACAMSQSTLVSPKDAVGCRSSAGAYNLSKSYIAFEIHKEDTGIGKAQGYFIRVPAAQAADQTAREQRSGIAVLVKPDPQYTYCLDYLASSSSNDTFKVEKEGHILKKITSKADDQSALIASTLIQTLFVGLSENPNFDRTRTAARGLERASLGGSLVFSGVVDPFVHDDVNRINDAIRGFGYCLFLEGEPVDPGHDDVDAYCDNPLGWARQHTRRVTGLHGIPHKPAASKTIDRAGQDRAPRSFTQGVFYRPRIGTTYYLYVKDNLKLRGVRGAWKLRATATAFLENAAPVFSVGIDRTFFAQRETTLEFDNGVLKDVTIAKGSELAGFVTIPLQVAQSVVALPANIIQVKINVTNNNGALIAAQDALINAKINLANSQKTLAQTPVPPPLPATFGRSYGDGAAPQSFPGGNGDYAQCMNPCLTRSVGNSEPACSRYCTCRVNLCAGKGDDVACENSCRTYLDQ